MESSFKVVDADKIELTLTLTANLKTWKELRGQLTEEWPSWDVGSQITDMICQAEKHFYPDDKS